MQAFKTVYFPDAKRDGKRGLTLAFGANDAALYEQVAYLSSVRVRELLGFKTLAELEREAQSSGEPINNICRSALRAALEGGDLTRPFADGLQATFSGGRDLPLQDWYPYLEGYSPDFVREILSTYAPKAKDVLDPFAGSGTTPLTIMSEGGVGYYSDVNPLCNFLIETKAAVRRSSEDENRRLSDNLYEISEDVEAGILRHRADLGIKTSYASVFGTSEFFDASNLHAILRTRAFVDEITSARLRALADVAAIRSLIPASRLVRRGDLRFKNSSELSKGTPKFANAFSQSLKLIANDLAQLEAVSGDVISVGESAMETVHSREYDAVITSPPYLNGTNYFRNTKIELWYMRKLNSQGQLKDFRKRAVTAGINDVTRGKTASRRGSYTSQLVKNTVNEISAAAYDPRIPDMVETYFNDMHGALSLTWKAIKSGGTLAIDIGDSAYAGVHVPTDKVLSDIVVELGGAVVDDVTLRERASRDGGRLRQCLLVFRKP